MLIQGIQNYPGQDKDILLKQAGEALLNEIKGHTSTIDTPRLQAIEYLPKAIQKSDHLRDGSTALCEHDFDLAKILIEI